MVKFANEVRKLFMGEADGNYRDTIEVTFSTRTLIRWADLTARFQPLARQGIQPVTYALDRALAYRATPETRTVLHELACGASTRPSVPRMSFQLQLVGSASVWQCQ